MPGSMVNLGPFTGGMVTRADATAIDDNECQIADNFIYDIKGTLVSRPPFFEDNDWDIGDADTDINQMQAFLLWKPLKYNLSNFNVLIMSSPTMTKAFYNHTHTHLERDTGNQGYSAACLYNGRVFFPKIYGNLDSGGFWNFDDTTVDPGDSWYRPMIRIDDMPVGTTIASYKNRLFVAGDPENPHRLYYSEPTPTGGNGFFGKFFDVDPVDGQYITLLVAYGDDLIVFKSDSMYYVSYGTGGPNEANTVAISKSVGTESVFSHTFYHDILYFYHNSRLYSYSKNEGLRLINDELWFNDKSFIAYSAPDYPTPEPQAITPGLTPCLSTWEDCLILSYFDRVFVYNLLSQAWTTWSSELCVKPYQFIQRPRGPYDDKAYYAVSNANDNSLNPDEKRMYGMWSEWTTVDREEFKCTFVSKVYNFSPGKYTKMFWWGASITTNLGVVAAVKPISLTRQNTWGDLKNLGLNGWAKVKTTTWGNLDFRQADIVDIIPEDEFGAIRRFYKFLQAMRFKMVVYRLVLDSDGTSINGPQRLHLIVPTLRAAETLVKKVS